MKRTLDFLLEKEHPWGEKMAFVSGPRQVGKTTLAQHILTLRSSSDLYRSWDDLEWRRSISREPYGFLDRYRPTGPKTRPVVVLDEIHKFPRWKAYLKGLWDTRKDRVDVLVAGSGRLDVYQRGGDSLLGRYHQYRLHPLSLKEILAPEGTRLDISPEVTIEKIEKQNAEPSVQCKKTFDRLLRWGGFPEPFLKQNTRNWRLWQQERRRLIVREDLRDLSRIQLLSHIEQLVELLSPRVGQLLSYNSLREDLQVALDSVRLWMDYLKRLYYIYYLRPYSKKISRALHREPKLYLWDWSETTDPGARFENMIASHLLKWCHFTQDWGLEPLELFFVRDKEKREVDFLLTKNKIPWILIEAKWSDPNAPSSLHHFGKQLGVKHKFLVVGDLSRPGRAGDVSVIDAPAFLSLLPV